MSKPAFCVKSGPGMKAAKPHPVGAPAPGEYGLQIDEKGGVTVLGRNSAKEMVDISALATLTAKSSDETILTVDSPVGMHVNYTPAGVGKATVTLSASATDGSFSFSMDDPCDVDKNAVRGLQIQHDTPVTQP